MSSEMIGHVKPGSGMIYHADLFDKSNIYTAQ
jgi:hypothetical protein